MSMSKSFRVYHKLDPPYSVLLECRNKEDTLIFESRVIATLTSAQTEVIKKSYVKLLDAYGCLGVLNLTTGRETQSSLLALVTSCVSVGRIGETDIYRISGTSFVSLQNSSHDEERVAEVKKILSAGTFYFSWSSAADPSSSYFDLSVCAQKHLDKTSLDERFFWNKQFHVPLRHFGIDCKSWLLKIMCGGVEVRTVYAAQKQGKACLISRLSCERAGTRFNVRGTNDEGHVANFVETEQVIYVEDTITSFIQTRGSVPLFWEQPGFQVGSHKVKLSRGYEASTPAFERHLFLQKQIYGKQVLVNLLGTKEGELTLSQAFKSHHEASKSHHEDVHFVSFDYHQECRGGSLKNLQKLKDVLKKYVNEFGLFCTQDSKVERSQIGSIRTNCLDCLDRTNSVQTMIGLEVLGMQLDHLGLSNKAQMKSRFEEVYKNMWTINGDHISRIYAGTGALGGGRSKAQDAARSANRTIQNNFLDSTKQEAINFLLHGATESIELSDRVQTLFDTMNLPLPASVLKKAIDAYEEYSMPVNVKISVGTWNVNGGKHFRSIAFKHEHITDWLLDLPHLMLSTNPEMLVPDVDYSVPSDIFAIGFEEIVDLNAGNIVSASTQNQKEWAMYLQKNISRDHKYIILTSSQLVGVCLFVFVRPYLAPHIKNLSVVSVKTGLGGATGNKGAVAIRFQLYNNSVCFVCSHFAAGQSNVKERNADFFDIANKITFPLGKKVWHHDHLFWCGDFNYRIDLGKDEVKDLISQRDWPTLQAHDQLNIQRQNGNVFQGFSEGPTNFAPTYKYDLFCDDYDTSEKCRVPAWTDRVLWVSKSLSGSSTAEKCKLLLYNKSELKTSDHRPVMALFEVSLIKCDPDKRASTLKQMMSQEGPVDSTVVVNIRSDDEDSDEILDDDVVDEILVKLGEAGEIILVRFMSNIKMNVTFRTGEQALSCLDLDCLRVANKQLNVKLENTNWLEFLDDELKEVSRKGVVDFDQSEDGNFISDDSNLLLSFECEEDDDDEVSVLMKEQTPETFSSLPATGKSKTPGCQSYMDDLVLLNFHDEPILEPFSLPPVGHAPLVPQRMAITPTHSLQSHQTDVSTKPLGVSNSSSSLVDDLLMFEANFESKSEQVQVASDSPFEISSDVEQKKVKPPRPATLPTRPPPPKFLNPASYKATPVAFGGTSKQQVSTHIVKPFYESRSQPRSIGLPTNVTRTGARNVEDAEKLIGQLMNKSSNIPQTNENIVYPESQPNLSKPPPQEVNNKVSITQAAPPLPTSQRPNSREVRQMSIEQKQQPMVGFEIQKHTTWYTEAPRDPSPPAMDPGPPPPAIPSRDAPPIPKNRPDNKTPPVPVPRRMEQLSKDDGDNDDSSINSQECLTIKDIEVNNSLPSIPPRPFIPSRAAPAPPPGKVGNQPKQESPSALPPNLLPQQAPPIIPARAAPAIPPRQNIPM